MELERLFDDQTLSNFKGSKIYVNTFPDEVELLSVFSSQFKFEYKNLDPISPNDKEISDCIVFTNEDKIFGKITIQRRPKESPIKKYDNATVKQLPIHPNDKYTYFIVISSLPTLPCSTVIENTETNNVISYITQEGIFMSGVPLYKIWSSTVGKFSSTFFLGGGKELAEYISNLFNIRGSATGAERASGTAGGLFIDGTSAVGTDSIAIRKMLNPSVNMIAFELDHTNFLALSHNVKEYSGIIPSNLTLIHGSSIKYLKDNSETLKKNDKIILYFDPPWGGRDYKKEREIDLFLDEKEFSELVEGFFNSFPSITNIIFKAPFNLNRVPYNKFNMKQLDIKARNTLFFDITRNEGTKEEVKEPLIESIKSEDDINPLLPNIFVGKDMSLRVIIRGPTIGTAVGSGERSEIPTAGLLAERREDVRKTLYENILKKLKKLFPTYPSQLGDKEISSIFLRYVFNLIIERTYTDDPIFITSNSTIANEQIVKDIKYLKLPSRIGENIIKMLKEEFAIASLVMRNSPYISNETLLEDQVRTALEMRYAYLNLSTLGLAYPYKEMKRENITVGLSHTEPVAERRRYKPEDNILEAFATPFNRFFNNYCSAFFDLESSFGSLGSFWNMHSFPYEEVFVNPPFDETIIRLALNKVPEMLANSPPDFRITFILPNWKDFKELEDYKGNKIKLNGATYMTKIIPKGKECFTQVGKSEKISPCEILWIIITKTAQSLLNEKEEIGIENDIENDMEMIEIDEENPIEPAVPPRKADKDPRRSSTQSKVVNVKVQYIRPKYQDLKEWCEDPNNLYIGRRGIVFVKRDDQKERFPKNDSKWCNPFKLSGNATDEERDECLKKYEAYITEKINNGELDPRELIGKNLGCWCKPKKCHGDVLLLKIKDFDK